MRRVKTTSVVLSMLAIVLVGVFGSKNEAKAQTALGFVPVSTHCFAMVQAGSYTVPVIVAYSSNCIVGNNRCLDNSCPSGSFEVQISGVED